jgi:exosortase K
VFEALPRRRFFLWWWIAVAAVAWLLKWHYSTADAAGVNWMLQPLAFLLQSLTGQAFVAIDNGEWVSEDAQVALVKGCAGINFMIMSFLGWCWLVRPRRTDRQTAAVLIEWPALIAAAFALAWAAALVVNTLRILLVLELQSWLTTSMDGEQAHRLLGLLIYLPALSLQMIIAGHRQAGAAFRVGLSIYAGLMLVTPLLTGHASLNSAQYREHVLMVGAVSIALGAAMLLVAQARKWRRNRNFRETLHGRRFAPRLGRST